MNERDVDAVLVERAQEGDRRAFDCLVVKYQRRLFNVVLHVTFNVADAEDVVQESFIKAFRALPSFRGEAGFYTWLFRIAINTANNFSRVKRRQGALSADLPPREDGPALEAIVVDEGESPCGTLQSKQVLHALTEILRKMPSQLSTALVLCEMEGLSYADISAMMNCPLGTVRSRIFRARELICCGLEGTCEVIPFEVAKGERRLYR